MAGGNVNPDMTFQTGLSFTSGEAKGYVRDKLGREPTSAELAAIGFTQPGGFGSTKFYVQGNLDKFITFYQDNIKASDIDTELEADVGITTATVTKAVRQGFFEGNFDNPYGAGAVIPRSWFDDNRQGVIDYATFDPQTADEAIEFASNSLGTTPTLDNANSLFTFKDAEALGLKPGVDFITWDRSGVTEAQLKKFATDTGQDIGDVAVFGENDTIVGVKPGVEGDARQWVTDQGIETPKVEDPETISRSATISAIKRFVPGISTEDAESVVGEFFTPTDLIGNEFLLSDVEQNLNSSTLESITNFIAKAPDDPSTLSFGEGETRLEDILQRQLTPAEFTEIVKSGIIVVDPGSVSILESAFTDIDTPEEIAGVNTQIDDLLKSLEPPEVAEDPATFNRTAATSALEGITGISGFGESDLFKAIAGGFITGTEGSFNTAFLESDFTNLMNDPEQVAGLQALFADPPTPEVTEKPYYSTEERDVKLGLSKSEQDKLLFENPDLAYWDPDDSSNLLGIDKAAYDTYKADQADVAATALADFNTELSNVDIEAQLGSVNVGELSVDEILSLRRSDDTPLFRDEAHVTEILGKSFGGTGLYLPTVFDQFQASEVTDEAVVTDGAITDDITNLGNEVVNNRVNGDGSSAVTDLPDVVRDISDLPDSGSILDVIDTVTGRIGLSSDDDGGPLPGVADDIGMRPIVTDALGDESVGKPNIIFKPGPIEGRGKEPPGTNDTDADALANKKPVFKPGPITTGRGFQPRPKTAFVENLNMGDGSGATEELSGDDGLPITPEGFTKQLPFPGEEALQQRAFDILDREVTARKTAQLPDDLATDAGLKTNGQIISDRTPGTGRSAVTPLPADHPAFGFVSPVGGGRTDSTPRQMAPQERAQVLEDRKSRDTGLDDSGLKGLNKTVVSDRKPGTGSGATTQMGPIFSAEVLSAVRSPDARSGGISPQAAAPLISGLPGAKFDRLMSFQTTEKQRSELRSGRRKRGA